MIGHIKVFMVEVHALSLESVLTNLIQAHREVEKHKGRENVPKLPGYDMHIAELALLMIEESIDKAQQNPYRSPTKNHVRMAYDAVTWLAITISLEQLLVITRIIKGHKLASIPESHFIVLESFLEALDKELSSQLTPSEYDRCLFALDAA